MRGNAQPGRTALILREDPDLAEGLSESDRLEALLRFEAPVIEVLGPRWDPPVHPSSATFGLLVLDGLLGRRVRLGRAVATELISRGDIVRPWEETSPSELVTVEHDWRAFSPVRMAVLDTRITTLISAHPQLVVNFSARLLRRARTASYIMVAGHLLRVEDRLLATLWHLAATSGRVTPQGVMIPFRLTHEVIGEIVGAHRPSVTVAVQSLMAREKLAKGPRGSLVLLGEPPEWAAAEDKQQAFDRAGS